MLLVILMVKKMLKCFMKKEMRKTDQRELRVEKVIKKGDKLHVKWKGYDNSFSSWIDRKYFIMQNESVLS